MLIYLTFESEFCGLEFTSQLATDQIVTAPAIQWEEFPFQVQFLWLYAGNLPGNVKAWEARLGEAISVSRDRFLYYGLIKEELPKSPAEIIRESSLDSLKGWAKNAGLKVSGRKSEVADRVISHQVPEALAFADVFLRNWDVTYELTEAGREICERFLSYSAWAHSDDWYDENDADDVQARLDVQRQFESRLAEMRAASIQFVAILGSANLGRDCQACLEMENIGIPIDSICLPLPTCDRKRCTCVVIAVSHQGRVD